MPAVGCRDILKQIMLRYETGTTEVYCLTFIVITRRLVFRNVIQLPTNNLFAQNGELIIRFLYRRQSQTNEDIQQRRSFITD